MITRTLAQSTPAYHRCSVMPSPRVKMRGAATSADPCTGARKASHRSGADSPRGVDCGQPGRARVPPGDRVTGGKQATRPSTILFCLTHHLLYNKFRDPGDEPKLHLFGQLKRITRPRAASVPDTSASAPGAPPRQPARDPRGGNFLRPRRILRQIGRRKLSKGYRWLRAMQDADELPKHGGDRKSKSRVTGTVVSKPCMTMPSESPSRITSQ